MLCVSSRGLIAYRLSSPPSGRSEPTSSCGQLSVVAIAANLPDRWLSARMKADERMIEQQESHFLDGGDDQHLLVVSMRLVV